MRWAFMVGFILWLKGHGVCINTSVPLYFLIFVLYSIADHRINIIFFQTITKMIIIYERQGKNRDCPG